MKMLLIILFIFSTVKVSFAQDTSFIIEAGTNLKVVIPAKYLYQYSQFVQGEVFYRDGNVSQGKMNYNRLVDEMQFITEKGDTLALNNEATIKFVCIDRDTFYFDHGFILVAKSNSVVSLGLRQGFKFADKRKVAAYDMMSSTSSVSSLSSFNDRNSSYRLPVKEQTVLITVTDYYFGDKYNHFVPATKMNLFELFPDCTSDLKSFFKKNVIDFANKNDFEKVMTFLKTTCY